MQIEPQFSLTKPRAGAGRRFIYLFTARSQFFVFFFPSFLSSLLPTPPFFSFSPSPPDPPPRARGRPGGNEPPGAAPAPSLTRPRAARSPDGDGGAAALRAALPVGVRPPPAPPGSVSARPSGLRSSAVIESRALKTNKVPPCHRSRNRELALPGADQIPLHSIKRKILFPVFISLYKRETK